METCKSLLDAGRFPHALFFAHLVIEKTLKALVVKETGEHAPRSHSLVLLAKSTGIEIPEEILDQLAEYTEFNIEARYPDEKRDFYRKCTKQFALQKFAEIEGHCFGNPAKGLQQILTKPQPKSHNSLPISELQEFLKKMDADTGSSPTTLKAATAQNTGHF